MLVTFSCVLQVFVFTLAHETGIISTCNRAHGIQRQRGSGGFYGHPRGTVGRGFAGWPPSRDANVTGEAPRAAGRQGCARTVSVTSGMQETAMRTHAGHWQAAGKGLPELRAVAVHSVFSPHGFIFIWAVLFILSPADPESLRRESSLSIL